MTILFSDIENSTALNTELGDEDWVKLLAAHDRLLRTYVDKHRGQIVKSQGDGYMVVFPTPELALEAALDIQRALAPSGNAAAQLRRTPIRVRIGPAHRHRDRARRATTSAATSRWPRGWLRWPTAARSW